MLSDNITFILINLLTFIPLGIIIAFMPYFTRKTELFGIAIPESMFERNDFRKLRRKYTQMIISSLLITLIFMISLTFFFETEMLFLIFTGFIFVYLFICFMIFLPFHKKTKQIKETENWYENRQEVFTFDMKFRDEKLTISNWWYIIPLSITLITTTITFIFYDLIPHSIVQHIDLSGNITYQEKSITSLLMFPGVQLSIIVLFIFINFIIKSSKQQVSVSNPEKSRAQNIAFRKKTSLFLFYMALLTIVLLSFFQFSFIYPALLKLQFYFILAYTVILIFGTILFAIKVGQGGSRVKTKGTTDEEVIDRDDDHFWKLGQFYMNKNDPAVFVEKRFGIGWTNNWAHPLSWVFIIGILILCFLPLIFI